MRLAISLNTALIDFFVLERPGSQYGDREGFIVVYLSTQTYWKKHAWGDISVKWHYVDSCIFHNSSEMKCLLSGAKSLMLTKSYTKPSQ